MEQDVVAAAEPRGSVRSGDQRFGLGWGEVVDNGPVPALRRDGQHLLDQRGMLWCVHGGVAEEGVDRGQAGVAGAAGVAAGGLQMLQESADERRVEVGEA